MGRFEEALIEHDEAVRLEPENGAPYTARGQVLLALGRGTDAMRDFDRGVELTPTQVGERAYAHLRLGRAGSAVEDASKLVELDPSPYSYASRAYYLTYVPGGCERATADLDRTEANGAEDSGGASALWVQAAVHLWGFYYTCPDRYDPARALELAQRAVALEPRDRQYRSTVGVALFRTDRYDEARSTLLEALPHLATDPTKPFFLAMACAKLGKRDEARRHFERADAYVQAHYADDLESARIRGEAARLLGLDAAVGIAPRLAPDRKREQR
jgi:tetratricopeptide (TPR) repeat protein